MNRSAWPRPVRAVTSPWVLSPLLVLALLVGAFAGYGAWTRSRPTHYARGGAFGVDGPAVVATSPSAAPVTAPAGAAAPTTSTSASPVASSTVAAGTNTSTVQQTRSGHTSVAAPVEQVNQPRPGTYELKVSGSEHVKFGPVSACTNTFPADTTLVVQPATGEGAGAYDFDQRFYPASANQHDERHIYSYSSNAVTLIYEEATVTCSGVKQSTTVSYSPAQIRVKLPLTPGATWHSRGGDANRTEDSTSRISGTSQLAVGGHSYLVYVINTHVTMSGSETGSRDQRWWWSPALGIPLQWQESLSGSRSGASYGEDITCTVSKLP